MGPRQRCAQGREPAGPAADHLRLQQQRHDLPDHAEELGELPRDATTTATASPSGACASTRRRTRATPTASIRATARRTSPSRTPSSAMGTTTSRSRAATGGLTNMTVSHNHFYYGHGMSIGSETYGGVSKMLVTDLSLDGDDNALRIKSNPTRGGRGGGCDVRRRVRAGLAEPDPAGYGVQLSGQGEGPVPGVQGHHLPQRADLGRREGAVRWAGCGASGGGEAGWCGADRWSGEVQDHGGARGRGAWSGACEFLCGTETM